MTRQLCAMSVNAHLDHFTDQTRGFLTQSLAVLLWGGGVGKLGSRNARDSREVRVLASHGVQFHTMQLRGTAGGRVAQNIPLRRTVLLRWNFRDERRVLSCRAVKDRTRAPSHRQRSGLPDGRE